MYIETEEVVKIYLLVFLYTILILDFLVIDFFGALRARVYDDEVRKFVEGLGVEKIGKRLVNSREGPPKFEQPEMTLDKLMEYGNMLVMEQENVKRVQLADQYLNEAALGDANADAIGRGTFYG